MPIPEKGRIPRYLNDYITNAEDKNDQEIINVDYCYRAKCGVPHTYKEAVYSPKAHYWIEAMQEEIESLKENGVFKLTNLPKGDGSTKSKKTQTERKKYKERFVARGCNKKKNN